MSHHHHARRNSHRMRRALHGCLAAASAAALLLTAGVAAAGAAEPGTSQAPDASVLQPIDPQHVVDSANQTWDDFTPNPVDYSKVTPKRDFHGAIVLLDFQDETFRITQDHQDAFGNPTAGAKTVTRDEVPEYYRSLLNDPNSTLNKGETIDEYWKEQTGGNIGVTLEAYGPMTLPGKSYEYGLEWWMNGQDDMDTYCPANPDYPNGGNCNRDVRADAAKLLSADPEYRKKYGDKDPYQAFDEIFWVLAGEDESSTWQEFGEMKYASKEDIPDSMGATDAQGNRLYNSKGEPIPNWAPTRYVGWTSWKAAARFWPNANYAQLDADGNVTRAGDSVVTEASGLGTYAHEFSHILNVADNYRNPFGTEAPDGGPLRDTAGTYDILSRGSFNGPGGPHTRWDIPSLQGDVQPAGMSLRNRIKLGVLDSSGYVDTSRSELQAKGTLVADVQAREVQQPGANLGVNVNLDGDGDKSSCSTTDHDTGWKCDGGGYDSYTMEVVDRMGTDSFQPDHGVMIAKAKKQDNSPFVWTIDQNENDIDMVDYVAPDGTPVKVTRGDQRQLDDALFHAGTDSGSSYEYEDKDNGLHFYVLGTDRDSQGVLHYTVAVRSTGGDVAGAKRGVALAADPSYQGDSGDGIVGLSVPLTNTGSLPETSGDSGDSGDGYGDDLYRVSVTAQSASDTWKARTPSAIVAAGSGSSVQLPVYAYRDAASGSAGDGEAVTITVTATSENDPTATATSTYTLPQPKPGSGEGGEGTGTGTGTGTGEGDTGHQGGSSSASGTPTKGGETSLSSTGSAVSAVAAAALLLPLGGATLLRRRIRR